MTSHKKRKKVSRALSPPVGQYSKGFASEEIGFQLRSCRSAEHIPLVQDSLCAPDHVHLGAEERGRPWSVSTSQVHCNSNIRRKDTTLS